jgi:hypothetical protein
MIKPLDNLAQLTQGSSAIAYPLSLNDMHGPLLMRQ